MGAVEAVIYAEGFCPQQLFAIAYIEIAMATLSCLPQVVCVHDSVQ